MDNRLLVRQEGRPSGDRDESRWQRRPDRKDKSDHVGGPQCTWVITGGTGAYTGLQGSGTCFANAENTFPWINHTENGQVSWVGRY